MPLCQNETDTKNFKQREHYLEKGQGRKLCYLEKEQLV